MNTQIVIIATLLYILCAPLRLTTGEKQVKKSGKHNFFYFFILFIFLFLLINLFIYTVQEGGTHDFSLIEQKWLVNYLNYSSFNKIFHQKYPISIWHVSSEVGW